MHDNCQNYFGYKVVATNHFIFRIKSSNQSYKIIIVPSVLVVQLPDEILMNFLLLKTCRALFSNIAYYDIHFKSFKGFVQTL